MSLTASSLRITSWLSRCAAWAAAAVVLAGCTNPLETDYSDLNLVDVSGTVTLDGEPLAGALILFESEDQTWSSGRTDDSGRYELMFNSEQSGVIPGRKIVRITMGGVGEEADADEADADGGGEASAGSTRRSRAAVDIPARYNRNSELTADVSPDRRQFNFPLRSD